MLGRMARAQCLVYAAKSTEDVRGSIPDQIADCRRAIEADGSRDIAAEYTDEAFSAYTGNRGPGLVGAMEHATELAHDHGTAELWVQHSDRLARGDGRSARHTVELALWALKHDVKIRTVQDPDTFRDLLYAVVTGQRNHEDSRRRSLALAAGRRRAAARGDYLGYRSDGYRVAVDVGDDGSVRKRLVIDPVRREAIEKVFAMALRGRSLAAIATTMNNSGWRTNPGKGKPPGEWRPEQVLAILKNPRYAGLSAWKGEVLAREAWPAYITERQHYRLQARLTCEQSARTPPRREAYLLRGLLTCGLCGSNLHAVSARARPDGSIPRSYVCRRRKWRYGKACEQRPINADLLERMFAASLPALLARDPDNTAAAMPDRSEQRRRILEAARTQDSEQLDAAIDQLLNLGHRAAQSRTEVAAIEAVEAWTRFVPGRRSPERSAETDRLTRRLRDLFDSLAVRSDATTVTFLASRSRPVASGAPVTIELDLMSYLRQARIRRRRGQGWTDAAILHALKAWAETNGRPPRWGDWRPSSHEHPDPVTVRKHFGSWSKAVRMAGLNPSNAAHPGRNWAWTDEEILTCLRDWTTTHGRPPAWGDWLKAGLGRPCLNTVAEHFGSWRAGLEAAAL